MNYCAEVHYETLKKPRMNEVSRRNMRSVTMQELTAAAMGTAILDADQQPPAPAKVPKKDRVYFVRMHMEDGPIKIGTSWNTYARFTNLLTASPYELTYLGDIAGNKEREHEFHVRFERLRMLGEWFHPDPELIAHISYELGRDITRDF
jgi:hypothetical protein